MNKEQLFESLLQEKVGKTIKTPYGSMQVVDEFVIEDDDKLAFVEKAEAKYKELDKEGWFSLENTEPYWYAFPYNRAKFTLCANKNNKVCFIDWRKADYDFLFENKESFFDKVLNEANIEVFPQNGKLQARNIGQQVVSSKTHDKTSGLGVKDVSQPLTRTQLDGTKAVIAYLKSQNKLNDISTQFDTDPHPDITFNGAGDAIITPDGGKGRPYTIPAEKLEPFYESISDYKGHMLLGAAVLGVGALSAIDHNKVKSTADRLGIELAETEYSSHEAAGLVGPIYEYKYDMKGPMNIDSLCGYLKDHTDFDKITYEDGGDHYVINYTDNYTTHQKAGNATVTKHRTSKGNLNLPKSYFDVSFVLDESKTALFDKLLEE